MASEQSTGAANRLSQSALARLLGVQRQAIHDLIQRGILTLDADGLLDAAAATAALARSLRADAKTVATIMAAPPIPPTPGDAPPSAPSMDPHDATTYHIARTLRETAEAKIAQLRLRVMAGDLVDATQVRHRVTTLAATARLALERIPDKLANRLAMTADPAACHAMLTSEIDQVMHDLCADADTLKFDATDGRT